MASRRLLVAILLTLLAAGCAGPGAGDAGAYAVAVVGPDGPFWNGTVQLSATEATALGALQAAAVAGSFSLDIEPTALGPYVRAVGPYRETAGEGWCVFLLRSGAHQAPMAAADAVHLRHGDAVLWSWTSVAPGPC